MDRHQILKQERTSKGLCYKCGNFLTDKTFRTCADCRKKVSEQAKEKLAKREMCQQCNKYHKQPGHLFCGNCLRRKKERVAFIRGERYRNGLCERCGINPRLHNKKRCQSCIDKSNQEYPQKADRLTGIRKQRREQGLCVICGINQTKKYTCDDCRRKRQLKTLESRYDGNAIKALQRDNYQCQLCGKTDFLHVHHIDGNGDRQEYPNHSLENLITLCRSCHISVSNLRFYKANLDLVIRLLSA